ncbi:MAG: diguanylate cyclase [Eubacterium sp.]|nr:diguanylate cyclase [Eubacterium sp.]
MIFTNEKCVGCNKCIRSCPVLSANVAEAGNINVDEKMCIQCGTCFDNCMHEARDYDDDTKIFLMDLKAGKKYAVIVAPAFVANYPNVYKKVYGYLKSLGVTHIYSASHGADITTWTYIRHLKETGKHGLISQPCSAIVNYIEKYQPELIPMLMPFQSPMMSEAIYLKKYRHVEEELVFLSPCIAKRLEIRDRNTNGYVKYNVTFKKLMEAIGDAYQNAPEAEEESDYGLGAKYPKTGGLKECVQFFVGAKNAVLQVEGEARAYQFLKKYAKRKEPLPYLVDIVNCRDGCIRGTATDETIDGIDVELALHDANKQIVSEWSPSADDTHNPWNWALTPQQRWDYFCEQFKELDIHDFTRAYTAKEVCVLHPDANELEEIFQVMKKYTPESRHVDCRSCGYMSCEEMACAIYNGVNQKENCIYYLKALADIELDFINSLAYTDTLTGVKNNTAYLQRVGRIKRGPEEEIRSLTVLVADINGLKHVNDTYGHEYGNKLIIAVSEILVEIFGEDHVYRIGGDEFAILLKDASEEICQEKELLFRQRLGEYQGGLKLSAALGSAVYHPQTDLDYDALFRRADKEMYAKKIVMEKSDVII